MKRRIYRLFLCVLLVLTLSVTVLADCGPKESTRIDITGVEGEYYVTLLSTVRDYGPHSVQRDNDIPDTLTGVHPNPERDAWYAFCGHGLEDFYFWGEIRECEGDDTFGWGYYPPDEFKVAVYIPNNESLLISEETYTRYAFTSGYRLDLSQADTTVSAIVDMPLVRDYGLAEELGAFLVRVIFTVAVELLLALLLFYRNKKQLTFILIVNICTQIGLNLLLAVTNYIFGPWSAIGNLLWGELVVVVVEASLYYKYLPKLGDDTGRGVGYAIAANLLSCILGIRMIF